MTFVVLANGTNYNNNIQQPFMAKLNVTGVPRIRTNASLKEMADNVVEGYRFILKNFQILSYANTTLSGNNAIKISYSYADPKNNGFKATDIATIKNNTCMLFNITMYNRQDSKLIYKHFRRWSIHFRLLDKLVKPDLFDPLIMSCPTLSVNSMTRLFFFSELY